jgi:hypothetical protein
MDCASVDAAQAIGLLPCGTLVSRFRDDPTDYEDFVTNFEDAAYWRDLGYLTADDSFHAPTLHINTWHDIGVRGTLEAADLMRDNAATEAARAHQHVIIGPGLHCSFDAAFANGKASDLAVDPESAFDFNTVYAKWLDHWLMDAPFPRQRNIPISSTALTTGTHPMSGRRAMSHRKFGIWAMAAFNGRHHPKPRK